MSPSLRRAFFGGATLAGLSPALAAAEADWLSTPGAPETPFPWIRLGFLVALTIVAVVSARRWGRARVRNVEAPDELSLLGKLPLGPKNGIAFIAVGSRRVLVGFGEQGVRPLARWEEKSGPAPAGAWTPVLRGALPNALFHES
ncbi:MAG TPA: flagellar biosynthetic protein FliO [Elusimicrobiota bacterium]|nr:flagellar biosynthetic protein FliO [Elusimicrobiota bacterium]